MARQIGALLPLLIMTTGCQSALIDKDSARWPGNDTIADSGVVVVETTGAVNETPYIAPIENPYDRRFRHEADADLVGVSQSNWPILRAKPGKRLLVFHMSQRGSDQLLPQRRTQVFSFDANIMDDLRRGRISTDQIGWSIYYVRTSIEKGRPISPLVNEIHFNETWQCLNREALRRNHWWYRLLE